MKIALCSSAVAEVSSEHIALAQSLASVCAANNFIVCTGGGIGIPAITLDELVRLGGNGMIYSPADSYGDHARACDNHAPDTNSVSYQYFPGYTQRSLNMIHDCDVVVIINGRTGTLSEFLMALEESVPVIVLTTSGGIAEHIPELLSRIPKQFSAPIMMCDSMDECCNALRELHSTKK